MNSRLATRLGGGRLKIKKKVLKKRKNPSLELAPTNSSILQEKPQHHVIFNSKPSSVTPTPEDSSPMALELKEIRPNKNSGSYTEEEATTTVRISTTSTVSSISGIEPNSNDSVKSTHPFNYDYCFDGTL